MLDLLARKASTGDLYVNMAEHHLENHEWGQAIMAIEKAVAKGRLSEPDRVGTVLRDIHDRLGIGSGEPRS